MQSFKEQTKSLTHEELITLTEDVQSGKIDSMFITSIQNAVLFDKFSFLKLIVVFFFIAMNSNIEVKNSIRV